MILEQLVSETTSEIYENFQTMEDVESALLLDIYQDNMDVSDVMVEACTITDALDIMQYEGINVGVDVNTKINFFEKIKTFFKKLCTKILDFFQKIGNAITTYFHEKVSVERTIRLKKNLHYLKDFYDAGISGSNMATKITVQTIKFANNQNFETIIKALDTTENNFDGILDEVEDFTTSISQAKNAPNIINLILFNPDSVLNLSARKYRSARKKVFGSLLPDANPDIISDSEAKKKIRERFFGEELTRTEQDIKAVIPKYEIFIESIDEKLYSRFKAFTNNSTKKIKESNKKIDQLVSSIDKAEDPTSSYSVASGIIKQYAKLLNLLSTCISVHWELFLTIRGEIIRDGLTAINKIRNGRYESADFKYELLN